MMIDDGAPQVVEDGLVVLAGLILGGRAPGGLGEG